MEEEGEGERDLDDGHPGHHGVAVGGEGVGLPGEMDEVEGVPFAALVPFDYLCRTECHIDSFVGFCLMIPCFLH